MTDAQMRLEVASMYPSVNWHQRVSRMPANQIFAIYQTKLQREERLKREADINNAEAMHAAVNDDSKDYHQIDIWEYLMGRDL